VRLRISQDDKMLRCLISFPIYVPDYQRLAMAEALCRINFSLYSGAMCQPRKKPLVASR